MSKALQAAYKAVKMKEAFSHAKTICSNKGFVRIIGSVDEDCYQEKNKRDFIWLQYQCNETEKRLPKYDEAAQLEMRWKIGLLEAKAGIEL